MLSIKWCLSKRKGLELIKPNENLSLAYLKKADEALQVMINEKQNSLTWSVSAAYYSMYDALYAVMMEIGVKCEIHLCSLLFLKKFLTDFYSKEDIDLIEIGFGLRNDLQYYVDKTVDMDKIHNVRNKAALFVSKSKQIISEINEEQINEMRSKLK